MPESGRPPRGQEGVRLTPTLLTAVLAALVSTAVVGLFWYLDMTAPPSLDEPAPGPQPGPPHRASLVVAVGVATVTWLWLLAAVYSDQLLRRIDHLGDRFDAAAARLREEGEQEGVFKGMAIERAAGPLIPRPADPPRDELSPDEEPAPDDDPPPTPGGGRIIPFPS